MLVPPLPWDRPRWRNHGGPLVVLLHGLWRGWRAMEPLARALDIEGFSTLNLPYPSTRLPVATLVTASGIKWKPPRAGNRCISSLIRSEESSPGRCWRIHHRGKPADSSCWPRRMAAAKSSIGPCITRWSTVSWARLGDRLAVKVSRVLCQRFRRTSKLP